METETKLFGHLSKTEVVKAGFHSMAVSFTYL